MTREMSQEEFEKRLGETEHPAGCTWGGFSCGYWLIVEGCDLEHWEEHFVGPDGRCPCGDSYSGANIKVFTQREDTA